MDKDEAACADYLARQNFSEREIDNLYKGKSEYKEVDVEE